MYSGTRLHIVATCIALASLGPAVRVSHAQGLNGIIESYYPSQTPLGQTTIVNIAMNGARANPVQSIEITPSTGITIGPMTMSEPREGVIWWAIPITVAKDAPAGPRTMVAVQMSGRTLPVTLTVPGHVPTISGLKVVSAAANAEMLDIEFAATDTGGVLGDAPRVFFTLGCGNTEPMVGVLKGKVSGGAVRVSIPNPHTHPKVGAPPPGNKCDLEVRAADQAQFDSNTLTTVVNFK